MNRFVACLLNRPARAEEPSYEEASADTRLVIAALLIRTEITVWLGDLFTRVQFGRRFVQRRTLSGRSDRSGRSYVAAGVSLDRYDLGATTDSFTGLEGKPRHPTPAFEMARGRYIDPGEGSPWTT